MGQSEVEKFLKKKRRNKKWYTTKEISNETNVSSAAQSLNKLFKYNEVKRKQDANRTRGSGGYVWKFKD